MSGHNLQGLSPRVDLPNGREFRTWRPVLRFDKTYFVAGTAPNSCDLNPGTKAEPFRTIGRSAQVLRPGQRVVVAGGVYRERVQPARGGTSPSRMISYQAAPGEEVIIRGSRVVSGTWQRSGRTGRVWRLDLDNEGLGEDSPFATPNVSEAQFDIMPWAEPLRGTKPYTLPCGLVFQDGRRLIQCSTRSELTRLPGYYFVRPGGRMLYVHLLDAEDPNTVGMEITVHRDVFAPAKPGLGYLHVKGFTIEHAGNPFSFPQFGALSTTRGHHWLIEDNIIRQTNGLGIDLGSQHGTLPQPRKHPGWHIVRANTVTECGVCGIAGVACANNLIEANILHGNAFHDVEGYFETAAIKTHHNVNTVIRRNVIENTLHGSGIWMDFANRNSRCTENVITGGYTMFGGIFIEASRVPNLIDRNSVWGVDGSGIYEHDCCNQIFRDNVIGRCTGPALRLRGKVTDRQIDGSPIVSGKHRVNGNIFFANGSTIETRDEQQDVSGNVEGN